MAEQELRGSQVACASIDHGHLRPALPIARVTIEPSFAPMFRLERV